MSQNPFRLADRRFTNQESAIVYVVRFKFAPVRQFLDSVTSFFRTIDFSDDFQAELGWSLWRLRCSVLFGLAQYNHEGLGLLAQMERILSLADRVPDTRESATGLMGRLAVLLEQPENPKLRWMMDRGWDHRSALFSMMAMRKSFGSDLISQVSGSPAKPIQVITSLGQMGTGAYSSLVIPGTTQYLSQSLFMKLFHRGEYSRIFVLLYEGESFRPKERLWLPESSFLPRDSKGKDLRIETSDVIHATDEVGTDVDQMIADRLFSLHGEGSLDDRQGIPSRFVLCGNGKGFYVAEGDRIRVWQPNASERLVSVFPAQLSEGDFVILEERSRGALLDRSGNRQAFEAGLDATRVWRKPLQALLLSRSLEEVAELMIGTGRIPERTGGLEAIESPDRSDLNPMIDGAVQSSRARRNLQSTISNWVQGPVYGPGDAQHMLALVQVLFDSGHIEIDETPEEAARVWFGDLERLRAGRRAAGRHVRDEIDRLLENSLEGLASPADGLEITLNNDMVVSLHQLAMISDQVSRVPESFLRKPI